MQLCQARKQYCARGGTNNEGRHHLLLLHMSKQVTRELLHVYINGTQLTAIVESTIYDVR